MVDYALLDLAPICEGHSAAEALASSLALARSAEALDFKRYWLAEHHNMPGVASSATAVLIGRIAAATSRIRVGSGGVMLPNHAPLMVAEQFGTLETLFPGRIDLGLGRAPGTDGTTAFALRRHRQVEDNFPRDVVEVMGYLGDPVPGQPVHAVPGEGTHVPVYILGSSLYGAELAAQLGLPYAFASHFAPDALERAREVYFRHFRPSAARETPYFMLAVNVFGAESDAAGRVLRSSMQLAFARLRTGQPGPLPRPVERIEDHLDPGVLAMVNAALRVTVQGSQGSVEAGLLRLTSQYEPDEIIFNAQIHDHEARVRSISMAARAMKAINAGADRGKRREPGGIQ